MVMSFADQADHASKPPLFFCRSYCQQPSYGFSDSIHNLQFSALNFPISSMVQFGELLGNTCTVWNQGIHGGIASWSGCEYDTMIGQFGVGFYFAFLLLRSLLSPPSTMMTSSMSRSHWWLHGQLSKLVIMGKTACDQLGTQNCSMLQSKGQLGTKNCRGDCC